jgi:hypothetical protein
LSSSISAATPTATAASDNSSSGTSHTVPIAIGVAVGVVLLGVVGVSYRRMRSRRRQRQHGWEEDLGGMSQPRDSTYGMYNQSDPFKSTLDQYHRAPDQPMYAEYQQPQQPYHHTY